MRQFHADLVFSEYSLTLTFSMILFFAAMNFCIRKKNFFNADLFSKSPAGNDGKSTIFHVFVLLCLNTYQKGFFQFVIFIWQFETFWFQKIWAWTQIVRRKRNFSGGYNDFITFQCFFIQKNCGNFQMITHSTVVPSVDNVWRLKPIANRFWRSS